MQKRSLEAALSERRDVQSIEAHKRAQQVAKAHTRYTELIVGGSGAKADVDELLKVAAVIGKSESQMHMDIGNIEAAQDLADRIRSLAGCENASQSLCALRDRVAVRVQGDIRALHLQLNRLNALCELARERCVQFDSTLSHLSQLKNSKPALLAGVEVPSSSIAYASREAGDVFPEVREWESTYTELVSVRLAESTVADSSGPPLRIVQSDTSPADAAV